MNNSKIRTLYARFKVAYSDMQSKGFGLDKDFVIISRAAWEKSIAMVKDYNDARKAIGRPN